LVAFCFKSEEILKREPGKSEEYEEGGNKDSPDEELSLSERGCVNTRE